MKTPFEILNVPTDADDRQIKKAYLDAVRRYPPEKYPGQFQKIRAAYERIASEKARVEYMLFDTSLPDAGEMVDLLLAGSGRKQGPLQDRFREILVRGLDTYCRHFDF